jgi:glutamate-ammonia-ligase adenylyltransferase
MLYELDMRLRPSGSSGLLVVHIDTFEQYQKEEAWTWEHQALVRTRCIYGDDFFVKRFNEIKHNVVALPRAPENLHKEIADMRIKMQSHLDKSTDKLVDIKQGSGGMVDIEFLVQYLVLLNAQQYPSLGDFSDNISILGELRRLNILSEEERVKLIESYCTLRDFGHKATLQGDSALIGVTDFASYTQNVIDIKNKLFVC